MSYMGKQTLAVVEDNEELRTLLEVYFEGEYRVVTYSSYQEATAATKEWVHVDVALLDYQLGQGHNGLQVAEWIRKRKGTDIYIILYTAMEQEALEREEGYTEQSVDQILHKPLRIPKLSAEIEAGMNRDTQEDE